MKKSPNKIKRKAEDLFSKYEDMNSSFIQSAIQQNAALASKKAKADASQSIYSSSQPSTSSGKLHIPLEDQARRTERRNRFLAEQQALQRSKPTSTTTLVAARQQQTAEQHQKLIVGQSQSLEKEYLRLTAHPTLNDVRPPEVLAKALEHVKQRWKEGCDYKYACEQLKSIRQDLTVQHIRDTLTVKVYEVHARLSIENKDWAEFRQSHAVLKQLYEAGIQGNNGEFLAYGLLLAATATTPDVFAHELKEIASCPALQFNVNDVCIAHALTVCTAYRANNYIHFLKQYQDAPRMSPWLMDLLLESLRSKTYAAVLGAYLPELPLTPTLTAWLGFEKKKETKEFVKGKGGVYTKEKQLDIKASRAGLLAVAQR